jgi:hypothetical protein
LIACPAPREVVLKIIWPIIPEGDMAPEEGFKVDIAAPYLGAIGARDKVRGDLAWRD